MIFSIASKQNKFWKQKGIFVKAKKALTWNSKICKAFKSRIEKHKFIYWKFGKKRISF